MTLEIIATSVRDCELIEQSKATRIELCAGMENDGLTPSYELVKKCVKSTNKPIMVMIRNRFDTFVYSNEDIELMVEQIKELRELDIEGFVLGCNSDDGNINEEQLSKLINAANGMKVTYHKAFDQQTNLKESLKTLNKVGITTILTQGGLEPITDSKSREQLKELVGNGVEILAGGGVNFNNSKELFEITKAIHLGSAVRVNKSYDFDIDIEKINDVYNLIKEV